MSIPTVDINKPSIRAIAPLTMEPEETTTAELRPRTASQKYSKEVKLMANSAKRGAATIKHIAPKTPPMAEQVTPTPSTCPAFPCFVRA